MNKRNCTVLKKLEKLFKMAVLIQNTRIKALTSLTSGLVDRKLNILMKFVYINNFNGSDCEELLMF